MGNFFQNEFNQVVMRFLMVIEPLIILFGLFFGAGSLVTVFRVFFAANLVLGVIYYGLLLVIWILWGSGDDSKNMSMRELFSPILIIAGILLFIILMLAVLMDDWDYFFPACGVVLAVTGFFVLLFYIEHSFKKKE